MDVELLGEQRGLQYHSFVMMKGEWVDGRERENGVPIKRPYYIGWNFAHAMHLDNLVSTYELPTQGSIIGRLNTWNIKILERFV